MSLSLRVLQHCRAALPPLDGSRLAVAVSGGLDSVVLLDLLCELRPALGVELVVAHVDHGLRGADSTADARFVRALAAARGLPCYLGRFHRLEGRGVEDAARGVRFAFLRGVPARYVALAHHLDDRAETALLRMLRASGPETMGSLGDRAPFLRPLREVTRAELRGWAERRGLRWREDASNGDPSRERNLVRAQILPQLERVHGGARGRLVALAEEMEELAASLPPLPPGADGLDGFLERAVLAALPPAQRARAVRALLDRRPGPGLGVPRATVQRGVELAIGGRPGARVPVRDGWSLATCAARLYCLPPPPGPVTLRLPGPRRWGLHDLVVTRERAAREPVLLRAPLPGERFGGQPLAEWLRRRGVPAPLRPYHPVFTLDGRVVWVPGGAPVDGSVRPRGLAIGVRASIPGAYAPGRPWSTAL